MKEVAGQHERDIEKLQVLGLSGNISAFESYIWVLATPEEVIQLADELGSDRNLGKEEREQLTRILSRRLGELVADAVGNERVRPKDDPASFYHVSAERFKQGVQQFTDYVDSYLKPLQLARHPYLLDEAIVRQEAMDWLSVDSLWRFQVNRCQSVKELEGLVESKYPKLVCELEAFMDSEYQGIIQDLEDIKKSSHSDAAQKLEGLLRTRLSGRESSFGDVTEQERELIKNRFIELLANHIFELAIQRQSGGSEPLYLSRLMVDPLAMVQEVLNPDEHNAHDVVAMSHDKIRQIKDRLKDNLFKRRLLAFFLYQNLPPNMLPGITVSMSETIQAVAAHLSHKMTSAAVWVRDDLSDNEKKMLATLIENRELVTPVLEKMSLMVESLNHQYIRRGIVDGKIAEFGVSAPSSPAQREEYIKILKELEESIEELNSVLTRTDLSRGNISFYWEVNKNLQTIWRHMHDAAGKPLKPGPGVTITMTKHKETSV